MRYDDSTKFARISPVLIFWKEILRAFFLISTRLRNYRIFLSVFSGEKTKIRGGGAEAIKSC